MSGGKRSIDEAVLAMKEKGYSFLIFPEARGAATELHDLKRGDFF
jgi:1-acyl-sn-glycerol-3-phosphate acyltransferase